jgi:P27 family predicted phage terminase small subunit
VSYTKRPELKILQGTNQSSRETAPIEFFDDDLPRRVEAPPYLDPIGRKEWNRLTKLLREKGLLEKTDLASLGMACQCYQEYVQCVNAINEHGGIVVYMADKSAQEIPLVVAKNKAMENYKKFMTEFGLSPGARVKLGVKPKREKSELELFMMKQSQG